MSRDIAAEALGTSLLLYLIVGSGIAAETLTADSGVRLLAHAVCVGAGLAALITMAQTVSGSHFNPSVTLGFWRTGSMTGARASSYVTAQAIGAVLGVVGANWSFGEPAVTISSTARSGVGLAFAEGVATFVLVLLILGLVRTGRSSAVPAAVGAWVAAVVFATSSTGLANPAVTVSRVLTDTYAGVAPTSTPAFLAAQITAGLLAAYVATRLYPELVPERSPIKERQGP